MKHCSTSAMPLSHISKPPQAHTALPMILLQLLRARTNGNDRDEFALNFSYWISTFCKFPFLGRYTPIGLCQPLRRRGERNDVKKTKIKEKMMNNIRDSKNSRMCEVQSKFPWMLRRLGILCLVLSRLRLALNDGCGGVRANRNFYIISHYILLQGSLVCGSPFSSTKTILPFCIRPNSEDFTRLIKKVQGWLLVWDKKKKDKYAV